MSKLYACIISPDAKRGRETLVSVAGNFALSIEMLDDGILFDVSGLERLIGKPDKVAQKILSEIKRSNIRGSVAVADTTDAALLLARSDKGLSHTIVSPVEFEQLPLRELAIENDALRIFDDLGVKTIGELRDIPEDDLINRYGREFRQVLDIIRQNDRRFLTPNVKENNTSWAFSLDIAVEDFEQLIFIISHGLDNLFVSVAQDGHSTEHLDIYFNLADKTARKYEIKTSFPTLEKSFWLKLINLKVSHDAPVAGILGVKVVAHFTKPRPAQKGLYAVSRPEPENLLLTANKLKKLVGEANVGTPILLDQRLNEAFALDAEKLPTGKESLEPKDAEPIIAFSNFHPPIRAEVLVRDGRLVYLKTSYFSGHVLEYSGVWKANSKWWDRSWKTQEWDVEIEGHGVYRLCKVANEWFLAGEYD